MQTMFSAMCNSPMTVLNAGITASATSITVVDGSKLPAAPNILVIGEGETAETISYTGKDGNTITGVTRGFQGTAQAWVAGTMIARYFTAYDHDSFKTNIEELDSNKATTTYVDTKVAGIINSAPSTLDTLNELATALGNDPNFATTVATQIGTKANSADVYTKTASDALLANKVDKVSGKGLSTEDYTTTEKSKLSGIEAGANAYTHPSSHSPSIITQDASNRFVSDAEKATWNGKLDATTNAVSATKLQTARTINGVSFDGSANITVADATKLPLAGGTLTGNVTSNANISSSSRTLGTTIKETTYSVDSSAVANQKVDLYFPANTAVSQNMLIQVCREGNYYGVLRKELSFYGTSTGVTGSYSVLKTESSGNLTTYFGIGDVSWDATTSRWKVTIAMRISIAMSFKIYVKMMGANAQLPALSSIYTSDATDIVNVSGLYNNGQLTTTGNVGIGTTSPTLKLHVNTTTFGNESGVSTPNGALCISAISDTSRILTAGVGLDHTWIQSRTSNSATFNSPLVLNPSGGNVGIGTTAPITKLQVNGTTLTGGTRYGNLISADGGQGYSLIGSNMYLDGSSNVKAFVDHATLGYAGIRMGWGGINFYTDSSATTKDATITPIARLTIANNGAATFGSTITSKTITGVGNSLSLDTTDTTGASHTCYITGKNNGIAKWFVGYGDPGTNDLYVNNNDAAGNILLKTNNTVAMTINNTGGISGIKFKITPEGGYAIKLTAGEALTLGEVVYINQAGADGKVYKAPISNEMAVGIVYASASVDADVWIIVSGIANVLPEAGVTAARGNVIFTSATTAGRVAQSAAVPTTEHWRECGHFLDSGTGNGVATRAIIHFN